ncbi:MAG: HAMP domain-containing protein [bacterium]|nr:HAMP domain-containing protein [bacterium]
MKTLYARLHNMSLRLKLAGLFALLFAALALSLFIYLPQRFQQQALSVMLRSSYGVIDAACYGIAPALYFDDQQAIDGVIGQIMLNETLLDVQVYESSGALIGTGRKHNWDNSQHVHVDSAVGYFFEHGSLRITKDVLRDGEVLGRLSLCFDLEPLNRELVASRATIAVLSLLVFGVGILLILLVGRLVTSRLQNIVEVSDAIARGDLTRRVSDDRQDELGHLAATFNEMVNSLQSANESLLLQTVELDIQLQQRLRAQQDAARVRDMLRDTIDSMPSPLVAVDPEGRIVLWNQMALVFAEMAEREIANTYVWDTLPLLAGQRDSITRALKVKCIEKFDRIANDTRGVVQYIDIIVYPLRGAAEGAVIRLDDVTEEVRMLELMAQTEKMMSVGGLAAGMAHEINNPLGIIMQSMQNIQRRIAPDLPKNAEAAREAGVTVEGISRYFDKREIQPLMQDILEAGKRAATIVTNMLNFSRHSSSGLLPTSVPDLLTKSVSLAANDYDLKKRYDFRHIEIVFEFDNNLPLVPCVETKIEQVLLNLLKNAAQAIGEHGSKGAPRIVCRAKREADYVRIEIEDNGPGMPEEVRRRVFEPFFTTKEVGTGTGLGLSVSYFIIQENHGGTLSVDSMPGAGTKFTIRLPLVHANQRAAEH